MWISNLGSLVSAQTGHMCTNTFVSGTMTGYDTKNILYKGLMLLIIAETLAQRKFSTRSQPVGTTICPLREVTLKNNNASEIDSKFKLNM